MIYTEMTKKALRIMFGAHKEQTDKSGMPYVFHPFHLAEQMNDEKTTIVALLHDVIEDTDITVELLKAEGFDDEVLAALKLLAHDKNVDYFEYVKKIKGNPIATQVKIADLKHNSDISRLDTVDEKALLRVEKYKCALSILTDI